MLEERGRIVAVEGRSAWVETQRQSVCHSCTVNKGCGSGVLARLLGTASNRFQVINTLGAHVGEDVVLGIAEHAVLRGSFVAYGLPLLGLFAGALAGEAWGGHASEAWAVTAGALGLGAGLWCLRIYTYRLRLDERYQPVVLRRAASGNARMEQRVES